MLKPELELSEHLIFESSKITCLKKMEIGLQHATNLSVVFEKSDFDCLKNQIINNWEIIFATVSRMLATFSRILRDLRDFAHILATLSQISLKWVPQISKHLPTP